LQSFDAIRRATTKACKRACIKCTWESWLKASLYRGDELTSPTGQPHRLKHSGEGWVGGPMRWAGWPNKGKQIGKYEGINWMSWTSRLDGTTRLTAHIHGGHKLERRTSFKHRTSSKEKCEGWRSLHKSWHEVLVTGVAWVMVCMKVPAHRLEVNAGVCRHSLTSWYLGWRVHVGTRLLVVGVGGGCKKAPAYWVTWVWLRRFCWQSMWRGTRPTRARRLLLERWMRLVSMWGCTKVFPGGNLAKYETWGFPSILVRL